MLLVELTGLYQLRVWDDIAEAISNQYHGVVTISEEPWQHRIVLGLVPLFGTIVLCTLPLLVAQAISAGVYEHLYVPLGETLDERVDYVRARSRMHEWGPLIATGALLAGRCIQISWIASVLVTKPEQSWWHGRGKVVVFGIVGLAYVAMGWWLASNGEKLIASGVSPGTLLQHFVLVEMLLLLALVPLTWTAIVRRLRSVLGQ